MKKVSLIIFVLVVGIPMMGLKMFSGLKAQNFINYYFTPKNLGFSTPQTAELAKYIQSNVDYYKGMLDLELPILRYQDTSFDIPITIKYISDGFKPGRRPSLIGNNWSLNVGGVITRNVFGRPDDEKGINQKVYRDGLLVAIRNGKYRYYSKEELYNLNIAKADPVKTSDIGDLEHDYAPDIFNFSFGGYNGYFFIGNNGKIRSSLGEGFQVDIDKLSVQDHYTTAHVPINSTIKITTPDGVIYEFGGDTSYLEYNVPNNPSAVNPSSTQITSWYLKSIHSANNNAVDFKYKKYIQRNEYKNFVTYSSDLYITTEGAWIPGYPMTHKDGFTDCYTFKDNLETPIIDEIIINDVHIKFKIGTFYKSFYNEGNNDLLYLEEIIESYGNIQKSVSFEYLQNGNFFFLHRLKLNSQATNPDIYSFNYNLSTALPDSRTIAVDHWGYWNGGYMTEEDTKTYLNNIDNRKAVNTNVADITMLTHIIFPTKGETRITYEPNYYNCWETKNMETKIEWRKNYSSTPIPCGGVRVKNISDYDPVSKRDIVRTYSYVSLDGNGSGVIGVLPKYRSEELTEQRMYQYINGNYVFIVTSGTHISISSNTIGRLHNISEHHIGYSDVIEQYSDNSKISYRFSSRIDVPDDESINGKTDAYPDIQTLFTTPYKRLEKYGLYNSNDMSEYRGKLLSKITHSNKQEMLSKQLYTYNIDEWRNNYEVSISTSYLGLAANRIYYTPCRVIKEVQADINGVEIQKMYSYNTKNMVSEERIVQSNKDTLQLSYIYPFENITAIAETNYLPDLIRINKISEPVITTKSVQRNKNNSNQLLSAIKYNFGKFNNQFLKSTLSEWSIDNLTSNENSLEKGGFTVKEQYLNYDDYGNITCLIDKNKDTAVYIWSYKGRYPIAEIKGTTYKQVKSALGLSPESLSHDITPDINKINALRIKLPNASINTYTHSPLIGLITSTNPQGNTTYFEYDPSGRLTTIKDNDQNLVNKILYKYFDQNFESEPGSDNYCNVTFDTSGPGGDGTIKTVNMKCGEQLPIPTPAWGYTFDGWYDGATKVDKVPNSPNRTITGRFNASGFIIVGDNGYIIYLNKVQKVGTASWNAIAYGNGRYVVIGNGTLGAVTTSTDGVNWTTPCLNGLTSGNWKCITYGGGKFVAANTNGYVATSTDGLNWVMCNQIGYGWQSITYGGGKYVLLGESGEIAISKDGRTWENKRQLMDGAWYAITNKMEFIAVGDYGMATSYDAITWTTPITTSYTWRAIIHGKGKYVLVGDNGYISTKESSSSSLANTAQIGKSGWRAIDCYDKYVTVGEKGYYSTSTNGVNWSIPEQIKDESGNVVTSRFNGVLIP